MLVQQFALRGDEQAMINFSKKTNEQLLELFRQDKARQGESVLAPAAE
jgi:hypothetical protein